MKVKKLLLIIVTLGIVCYFIPFRLLSDDLGKANKYYERYDYQYAIEIYESIISDKPTLEVAQKLANCYRFVNKSIEAEKAYATVLTFPGFDPINYIYYAEALKQNGKFEQAKKSYLIYAERMPAKSDEAVRLANGCDAARLWLDNPDIDVTMINQEGFNSEYSDFSPIPYKKGFIFTSDRQFLKTIYNKKNKSKKIYGWTGNPFLKLYQAENQNDTLDGDLKLTLMPIEINDQYHAGPATLTADGKLMYFTKSGIVNDPSVDANKIKDLVMKKAIYYSIRLGNGAWSPAVSFPYNSPYKYSIQHPALSPDGKILYFASDMPGSMGGMDIFYCENTGSGWTKPKNCGPAINTTQDEVFPYVRKDGKLYFSSRGHITIGGLDIFTADGTKSEWTEAENLKAPYNSPKDDFGICFFEDNLTGFISSNRAGGKGSDDIYQFSQRPKEKLFFAVEGDVVEKGTENPMSGVKVFLINKNTGEQSELISQENGKFKFDLLPETDYLVRGDITKYFSRQEGEISTKGAKESTVYNVKFEVEKGEDSYIVKLNNIYYDFDKFNIRKDAEPELMKVLNFMNATPNVNVELRSHTDARGKAEYNMWLSEKRAQSAKNYLLTKGAEKDRLTAKGYGETLLINKCADGVKCTKEEHQLNRRTEFKVVKINPTISYVPKYKLESIFPVVSGTQ